MINQGLGTIFLTYMTEIRAAWFFLFFFSLEALKAFKVNLSKEFEQRNINLLIKDTWFHLE